MSTGRFVAPGKTRSCPHCRATVLDSATVCPGCHHHLRFGTVQRPQEVATPLRVEGTLRHPPDGSAWEYSVVLSIRNDRGEEIARQIVGVGAINPAEARTFSLAVEVFKPAEVKEPAPQPASTAATRGAADLRRPPEPRAPGAPRAPGVPGAPVAPGAQTASGMSAAPSASGARAASSAAGRPGPPVSTPTPGAGGVRPGVAAPWPDSLRPPGTTRGGSTPAGGGAPSRGGSVFKDPRPPGSVPGLQPKRR